VAIDPDDELTSRLLDAEVVRRRASAVGGADYAHTWVADVSDDLKGAHRGAVADHQHFVVVPLLGQDRVQCLGHMVSAVVDRNDDAELGIEVAHCRFLRDSDGRGKEGAGKKGAGLSGLMRGLDHRGFVRSAERGLVRTPPSGPTLRWGRAKLSTL